MEESFAIPFIDATRNVIETFTGMELLAMQSEIRDGSTTVGDVTGIIPMVGQELKGVLVLTFDQASALRIVNAMLRETFDKLNSEIQDAIGEITNMVCGGVNRHFGGLGQSFQLAQPTTLMGRGISLESLAKGPFLSTELSTEQGSSLRIELAFSPNV